MGRHSPMLWRNALPDSLSPQGIFDPKFSDLEKTPFRSSLDFDILETINGSEEDESYEIETSLSRVIDSKHEGSAETLTGARPDFTPGTLPYFSEQGFMSLHTRTHSHVYADTHIHS